jgi:rhamnogalacturonyl hydrolase YesR
MRRTSRLVPAVMLTCVVAVAAVLGAATVPGTGGGPDATGAAAGAGEPDRGTVPAPRPSDVVTAMHRAIGYYGGSYAVATGVRNGWSWSTYVDGVLQAYRTSGEAGLLEHATAWGRDTAWTLTTREEDPNEIKAAQNYAELADLAELDPPASLASADARMRAGLSLPDDTWTWADALFMTMPAAARWARRTGDAAYLDTMDRLYRWTRDDGITADPPPGSPTWDCAGRPGGLYDPAERLWYRDCSFIGRLEAGRKVFWGRGNAWVAAAMAETLEQLPPGDPRAQPYVAMLRDLAGRLREVQGADGMWRTSLLDAAHYPVPETSATGLFAYAIARGVTLGLLDRDTYAPVALRAWDGLIRISLQPSGFLSRCQTVGDRPGTPYQGTAPRTPASPSSPGTLHTDAPPFCVGAFLLAGSAVARLAGAFTAGRPPLTFAGTGDGGVSGACRGRAPAAASPRGRGG